MDTLDYGISSPQLALMNNGQVFVGGQIEPPMNPPSQSQSQSQAMLSGIRPMDAGVPTTITAGSDLFGTITTGLPMVQITQIQCASGVPVSYNYGQTTVTGPNWAKGVAVQDGLGSSQPAVYLVNGNASGQSGFSVRLSIAGVIPGSADGQTATLTGTLQESTGASYASGAHAGAPLTFTGQFTMAATNGGDIPVQMTITNLPSDLRWYRGDVQWTVALANGQNLTLSTATRMEIFTILDSISGSSTPPNVFAAGNGVWPEMLRLLFGSAKICGISIQPQLVNAEQEVMAGLTSYLHWNTNLLYGGPANYLDLANDGNNYGGPFKLKNLLVDLSNNNIQPRALCFDLAGALQVFGESIGITPWWECSNAFGYIPGINTDGSCIPSTHLIGLGLTNNPGGSSMPGSTDLIYGWNQNGRTYFTGHGFLKFNGLIFDATVGPHLGIENLNQYLPVSIDGFASDGSQDLSSHHYFLYVYYLPGNGTWQAQHASWTQYYQGANTTPGQVAENNVGITEVE